MNSPGVTEVRVAAGLATLNLVQVPGFYQRLGDATAQLLDGLVTVAARHGVAFSAQHVGGMFGLYFRASVPQNYAQVMECDVSAFNRFFHGMLDAGVYFAPSAFEAGFVSAAHGEVEITATLEKAEQVFSTW